MKAFKDANKLYTKQDWRAAAEKYEEAIQLEPRQRATCYFYLGNSYDNMYRPTRKGEANNDALPREGDRQLQAGRRDERNDADRQAAVAAVPGQRLRLREAERPDAGRAGRQGDDRPRAERADQLLRARRHLRGLRRIRAGRADLPQGQGSAAQRPGGVYAACRLLQQPGRLRQDHRSGERPHQGRAEQPRGVPDARHLLLGQGVPRLPPDRQGEAAVRA